MKRIILFLIITLSLLQASNFRDGVLSYRKGDYAGALKSFKLALKQDHVMQANYMLGKMYMNGEGTTPQLEEATKYLEIASKIGNIRSDCYLAEAYLKSDKNIDKAIKLINQGIKRNIKKCKEVLKIYNTNIKQEVKK